MATSISWPVIGGAPFSIPAAGEVGWPNLSNFLIALQDAQGTDAQVTGTRTATTSPVNIAATDCVVRVKLTVPGAATVNLPAGYPGQYYVVVDETGDAGSNNVTIVPNGSETINGASSLVLDNDFGAYALSFRGTSWVVIGSYAPSGGGGSIPRSDIAPGTANWVVINSGTGALSEEQYLSQSRGGMGANVSAFAGFVRASAGVFSASALTAAEMPSGIDALKIGGGAIDNTEFSYLNGVTSNIQTQLDGKAASGNYITALTGNVVATGPGSVTATIQAGVIVNSMVSASAAIAYSKLNLTGSIVNADVSGSAAIAYSKLNLTGSIVNADIANGTIDLTAKVSGALPIANGGTGQTTKTPAFHALSPTTTKGDLIAFDGTTDVRVGVGGNGTVLTADSGQSSGLTWTSPLTNPMTTLGDIIYENASPAPARLAGNTSTTKNFLTQTGNGTISAAPVWGTIAAADYPVASGTTRGAYLAGSAPGSNGSAAIAVGNLGQVQVSTASTLAVYTASNTWENITSIVLTAGTYLVSANLVQSWNNGTTQSILEMAISGYSAGTTTDHVLTFNFLSGKPAVNNSDNVAMSMAGVTVRCDGTNNYVGSGAATGSTTLYLKSRITYTGTAPQRAASMTVTRIS